MKVVVFDTETTGMPDSGADLSKQPFIIQFAAITFELSPKFSELRELSRYDQLVKPPISIPVTSTMVNGINDQSVENMPAFAEVIDEIQEIFQNAELIVAHNLEFDEQILQYEFKRQGKELFLPALRFDTMKETKELCKMQGRSGNYKLPRLMELHQFLFGSVFENAHNAIRDVEATAKCFEKLVQEGYFVPTINTNTGIAKQEAASEQISLF